MKKRFILSILLVAFTYSNSFAYGPIGHRTVAKVAEFYLTDTAKQQILDLLDGESLVLASTYADNIKSDRSIGNFDHLHYVNAQDGQSYSESEKNPKGDIITAINNSIAVLKDKSSSKEDKVFNLKMLIHFIGDLHQPLHTGRAEDMGGNAIKLKWFNKSTNLHRVWDSDMINHNRLSYTELAETMVKPPYLDVKEIEKGNVISWYNESKKLSKVVYNSAQKGDKLYYSYNYKYFPVVKDQLNKAGIRLALILNDIFK